MKLRYIDLMEKTLSAYSDTHIREYFERVKKEGLTEHGFARLTANIGILISFERRKELMPLFCEMLEFCCQTMPFVKAANDFSLKEIIFCLMALEENGTLEKPYIEARKAELGKASPRVTYTVYAESTDDKVHNWALFTAVSEYMRQHIGLCESGEFIDTQIGSQLKWLDENGMYRDPNEPMVYDLVPRGLFAILLHFGYNGKYREAIDSCLYRTADINLKLQSVSGEAAYGGRSNQFLHNEAQLCTVLEYEAARCARNGDTARAAQYKRAVKKALDNIEMWLNEPKIRHIKNRFPLESRYGCEEYAYFDKYMITAASFLYAAFLMCNDSVESAESDAQTVYTMRLSEHFHKIFMRAEDYFLEFDTNADPHYDSFGLGRVHKKGAPSQICLSLPCAKKPNYVIDTEGASDISLCAGYIKDGGAVFATDVRHEVLSLDSDSKCAYCELENKFSDGTVLKSEYTLSENGVQIKAFGAEKTLYLLPAFLFDGEKQTKINCTENILSVQYEGYECIFRTNGRVLDSGRIGANRNGHYKAYYAEGDGSVTVDISIRKA